MKTKHCEHCEFGSGYVVTDRGYLPCKKCKGNGYTKGIKK